MAERRHSPAVTLARPGYLIAILFVVLPLGDLLANVWPPRPGDLQWRYGAGGLLSGFLLTPLLGDLVAVACAAVLEHRVVQRILAIVNLVVAVVLLLIVGMFVLDWLQVRPSIPAEGRGQMDLGSAKSVVKYSAVVVAIAWLGIAGWRASRGADGRRTPAILVREPGGEVPN